MTKITKNQKKFIKSNYKSVPLTELAAKTGISEKEIVSYIGKSGRDVDKIIDKEIEDQNRVKFGSVRDIFEFIYSNRLIISILAVLVFTLYFNSLNGEFVADDILAFRDNPEVRDIKASFQSLNIQKIIYSLSFKYFGLNPSPLHFGYVTLHFFIVVLIFIFCSALFNKKTALLASLIFAASPVNTEAVAWISASNYIINTTGFMLLSIAYFLYKNSGKKIYLFSTAFIYFLWVVILINHFSITFLPLLVIIDLTVFEKKISFKSITGKLPLLSLTLVHFIYVFGQVSTRIGELSVSTEANTKNTMPYLDRVPYTIYSNIKLLLFPKTLSIFHEGDVITDALLIFMWVVLIAFIILIFYFWKKKRYISGLLIFIPVSLAPTFSPVIVSSYFSERYLYLGNIVFCILLALALLKIEKLADIKRLSLFITIVLIILYSVRGVIRNTEWETPKKLWQATAASVPYSPRAHRVLGDLYLEEEDYTNAAIEFEKAVELRKGDYAGALNNLGLSYLRLGNFDMAEKYLLMNIQQYPYMLQPYLNLSEIEMNRGNIPKSRSYLKKVLELEPGNKTALNVLSKIDSGEIK